MNELIYRTEYTLGLWLAIRQYKIGFSIPGRVRERSPRNFLEPNCHSSGCTVLKLHHTCLTLPFPYPEDVSTQHRPQPVEGPGSQDRALKTRGHRQQGGGDWTESLSSSLVPFVLKYSVRLNPPWLQPQCVVFPLEKAYFFSTRILFFHHWFKLYFTL